jgi:hypothetical protein
MIESVSTCPITSACPITKPQVYICAVLSMKKIYEKVILLILNKFREGSFIKLGLFGVFSLELDLPISGSILMKDSISETLLVVDYTIRILEKNLSHFAVKFGSKVEIC